MRHKRTKKGVTFIIYRPDKTILMQFRDEECRHYPNGWCFPGGECEENEKPIEVVIREAQEEYELKLDKNSCKLFLKQPHPAILNEIEYVFFCQINNDQKPILHEGADMKWMTFEEIKSTFLGFGDETIIPRLEKIIQKTS